MQVRCDEGVAIHIGPKPCVCAREGAGEASAGERIGQPLSRESHVIPGADVLIPTEGHMAERDNASVPTARRRRLISAFAGQGPSSQQNRPCDISFRSFRANTK